MLEWKIDKNVISELYLNGENIIEPWGIETADSSAFFSLEEGYGYRYKIVNEEYKYDRFTYNAEIISQMKEGKWKLIIEDNKFDNFIIRRAEVLTLKDSFFMDFVMRFRFKKKYIKYAIINETSYQHNNTNIYYQFPVNEVFLKGENFEIKISVIDKIVPENFEPMIYVRDAKDEWIVHVRMVPKNWDKEVIKICTKWASTRPLPQMISRLLLSNKMIKELLWYRGERDPFKNRIISRFLNPAAFAMSKVKKNNKLMWYVKMEIL